MNSTGESLSFDALERRIQALPDGPAAILNTPRPYVVLNLIGTGGMVIGILPFLMIQFLTPQMWMVWMARVGMWIAVLAYAPGLIRSVQVILLEFWRWKPKLVEQSDHDLTQFRELRRWLRKFPGNELEDHHRFAVLSQQRLSAKLGLLQGGFDKLGVLPALLALLFLVANSANLSIDKLLEVPFWQSGLALVFAITYLVGFLVMLMRLRLQLYELVLADALDLR